MDGLGDRREVSVPGVGIEAAFLRWGYCVIRHRWLALTLTVAMTVLLASQVPSLEIDNSLDSFLLPTDPAAVAYHEFREQFGREDRIFLAIEPEEVFSLPFLRNLHSFHRALEQDVPYIEEVTSLFNARSTRADRDVLVVEDLLPGWLDQWPASPSIEGLKERVLSNPLYVDALISRDARITTVTLEPFTYSTRGDHDPLSAFGEGEAPTARAKPLTPDEVAELMRALHDVIARFDGPGFRIYPGGALVATDYINRTMEGDSVILVGGSLVTIAILLLVLFRRLAGALLPVAITLLSVISSLGIMILLDIPATTSVQMLPIFLLAVGVCDAVHILTITYQRIEAGSPKADAIAHAMGHSGLAVVMTSATTAVGMMSFLAADMTPIVQLGIIAPIGVGLALLYTLVLLPATLAILPLRPPRRAGRSAAAALSRGLAVAGDFSACHPKAMLAAAAVFSVVCIGGAVQTRFSHEILLWFEPEDPMRIAAELLDAELNGSMSIEVVLDTGRENGLHDPSVLRRIDAAAQWAEGLSDGEFSIGKATSLVDIVKETHQALHQGRPEYRVVPSSRELVAQELLLFESGGAGTLEGLVDSQFRTARLSLRTRMADASHFGPFLERLGEGIGRIVGDEVRVSITGLSPVFACTVTALIKTMARSYAFAILLITPLMIALLRNPRLGLVSMLPNVVPLIFTLGFMGWFDIPLDYSTSMVGAIVIGLSVDDTIHFMHKFRMYHGRHGDSRRAVRETLESTGAALLFTTLVLAGGFFIMTTATLVSTRQAGFLTGLACLVALVADVVLGPALMVLCARPATGSQLLLDRPMLAGQRGRGEGESAQQIEGGTPCFCHTCGHEFEAPQECGGHVHVDAPLRCPKCGSTDCGEEPAAATRS